jgi:hypothetical protein
MKFQQTKSIKRFYLPVTSARGQENIMVQDSPCMEAAVAAFCIKG